MWPCRTKINILIVDDLPDKLLALETVLESWAKTSSRPAPAGRRCAACWSRISR